MKKIFVLAIVALSFAACRNANTQTQEESAVKSGVESPQYAPVDAPVITFEREIFDFGKIKQGDVVTHEFKFKNTGKNPLIIAEATATCGCTIPQWPREPILPGKESLIKVSFNSTGKMGMQDKVVTITSNANPTITSVHLVGEVLEKK
ncbi:DUF1573 domain-containing protein [Pedobacter sp. MW01-1-1]|uniref:DUF1573 domain-containing protein n=1 Tax=Pedobacter sp. MW01-1-1 TaxID=3383027 RepID=UPI003FEF06DA